MLKGPVKTPFLCKSVFYDERDISKVENVKCDDFVLVFNGLQHFWIKVLVVNEDNLLGQVNNYIQHIEDYTLHDVVQIKKEMVENVFTTGKRSS